MVSDRAALFGLLTALGGGLLIGIERERRKGTGPARSAIGLRTCTISALAGSAAALLGTTALWIIGLGLIAFVMIAYLRSDRADPGLTTEIALLATLLLGALAITRTELAAALFIVLAIILAGKDALHRFARDVLTERELDDALLLAASVLIVFPLLPDRAIDPFGMLNPRSVWLLAVLVMSVNAAGYVALRLLGPGRGLAIAGLLGGFVSSSATIGAMAERARSHPALRKACVAGSLLSTIATLVQLALILSIVSSDLLAAFAIPLLAGGITAAGVGGIAWWRAQTEPSSEILSGYGRAFALPQALLFAGIVTAALIGASVLQRWLGVQGVFAAAAATGLADVHAAAITLGHLVSDTGLVARNGAFALSLAFTTNSIVKCILAAAGGVTFARPVVAGIALINLVVLAALWRP
ncbi:MAG: DUF4010 domain-containing protein [Dokdonella sp.]|uniref:MgtC/SapB family protein n=1 Tax=Dokdonella sp. TaxID=2291710 RepID=UPI0032641903